MEDSKILDLFWQRSEHAVAELSAKYGRYCSGISLQNVFLAAASLATREFFINKGGF